MGAIRRIAPTLLALALALTGVLVTATPAAAHALAQSSDPAPGATLATAPAAVTIVFGEQPDPHLSSVRVLDTGGHEHQSGPARAVAGHPDTLTVTLSHLDPGVYTVAWRTLSQVDGHLAAGAFAFGVGVTPTGAAARPTVRSPGASGWAVAGRWLFDAGTMLTFGAALIGLLAGLRARRIIGTVALGLVSVVAGMIVLTEQQRRAAGLAVATLAHSSIGRQALYRAAPAVVALVALALLLLRPRRAALVAVAGAAVSLMVGDVLASHAAGSKHFHTLRIADQTAHIAAVSAWLGGLAALVIALPVVAADNRVRLARRFSTLALTMFVVVALTGTQRALDEVGSWHALFHSAFGRWVLLKIAVIALLFALGAWNRSRGVARAESGRLLRRVGTVELGFAAVALVATGFLQSLAPATSAAAGALPRVTVSAHDFATTIRVRLTLAPGMAGFNTYTASVTDYDSGRPVTAAVSLRFRLADRPEIGESTLPLRQTRGGSYVGQGANLSVEGTWTITVLVERGAASVEVPLRITPRTPPQRVDVTRAQGQPDLFTVHIGGGRTIQIYLDPQHAGARSEFHFTPVGPDQQEFPVSDLAVRVTPPNGHVTGVATRRLDPIGHFVADIGNTRRGRYKFAVRATTPDGNVIAATVTISVS